MMFFRFRWLVVLSCSWMVAYGAADSKRPAAFDAKVAEDAADSDTQALVESVASSVIVPLYENTTIYKKAARDVIYSWYRINRLTKGQKHVYAGRMIYEVLTPAVEKYIDQCLDGTRRKFSQKHQAFKFRKDNIVPLTYQVLERLYGEKGPNEQLKAPVFQDWVYDELRDLVYGEDGFDAAIAARVDWTSNHDMGRCIVATLTMFLIRLWEYIDEWSTPQFIDSFIQDNGFREQIFTEVWPWMIRKSKVNRSIGSLLESCALLHLTPSRLRRKIYFAFAACAPVPLPWKYEGEKVCRIVEAYSWLISPQSFNDIYQPQIEEDADGFVVHEDLCYEALRVFATLVKYVIEEN